MKNLLKILVVSILTAGVLIFLFSMFSSFTKELQVRENKVNLYACLALNRKLTIDSLNHEIKVLKYKNSYLVQKLCLKK